MRRIDFFERYCEAVAKGDRSINRMIGSIGTRSGLRIGVTWKMTPDHRNVYANVLVANVTSTSNRLQTYNNLPVDVGGVGGRAEYKVGIPINKSWNQAVAPPASLLPKFEYRDAGGQPYKLPTFPEGTSASRMLAAVTVGSTLLLGTLDANRYGYVLGGVPFEHAEPGNVQDT
ncbi:MAG TPA: hypothetical protein VLF43_02505 [Candidatus Saccharimonadales bacterium]|nr:hypothetical protein [Candidatus Saccharimonadales bacterium]